VAFAPYPPPLTGAAILALIHTPNQPGPGPRQRPKR